MPTDDTLSVLTADDNQLALVAALGRETADSRRIDDNDITYGHTVRILRGEERVVQVNFERLADYPSRNRGTITLHDPAGFADYTLRLANPAHTALFADLAQRRITSVFNDHASHEDPGWRDHTAVLQLQVDPEWAAWAGRNDKLTGQVEFAEFLEQYATAVTRPDAATMIEVAASFSAIRNANFDQKVSLTNSDLQLRYTEETKAAAGAKGTIEVPKEFTLNLSPYLGVEPVEMTARLRWRLHDGHLGIGYQLHRPDLVERDAFSRITASVTEASKQPLFWGAAPSAVTPARAE